MNSTKDVIETSHIRGFREGNIKGVLDDFHRMRYSSPLLECSKVRRNHR